MRIPLINETQIKHMGDASLDPLKAAYAAKAKLFSLFAVKFKLNVDKQTSLLSAIQARSMPVESKTAP